MAIALVLVVILTSASCAGNGGETAKEPSSATTTAPSGGAKKFTGPITKTNICSLFTEQEVAVIMSDPVDPVAYPSATIPGGARCDWNQMGTTEFASLEAGRLGAGSTRSVVQAVLKRGSFRPYNGVGDIAALSLNPALNAATLVVAKGDVVISVGLTHGPPSLQPEPMKVLAAEILARLAG